jgi:hypothetical protein
LTHAVKVARGDTDCEVQAINCRRPAVQETDALTAKLKRTVLQHKPSSISGREIVQVLTEIPEGVESGWHVHPDEEVGHISAEPSR